jgi:chaperonin cofactor prefoldin
METVRERLNKAQASGNRSEIRAALLAAKEAGADPASIEQALAELERVDSEADKATECVAEGKAEAAASNDEAGEARTRAEGLKKRGNDCLKNNTRSAARDAAECYTAGLEVRCEDRILNAQLYSNRAHARILLRQYVEAVDDCRKAIEIDPRNMKAYWRAAKASLNLDLCRNGIEFCEAGLRQEPNDNDLMKLRTTCAEKLASQQQKKAEMASASRSSADFNADEAMAVQENVNQLSDQCDMMANSLMKKKRERHKAQVTQQSLNEAPQETNMYLGVGRAFFREERSTIEQRLQGIMDNLDEDIPKLTKTHAEMEKRKEAAEKEFREMISAYKQQSA